MGRNITTLGQATNTQPQVTSVTSATGFQAGDLVYNLNGSYGPISDTAVSTGTFPINATRPYAVGNGILSGNVEVVEGTNVGAQYGPPAAKLTNGNTVIVWMQGTYTGRSAGGVYFKIINSAGAEVVAPTVISTATSGVLTWAMIGVVALTGGGFAVAWMGSSNNPYRATYDNAGVQTGAPATNGNTMSSGANATLAMTPTTNGGFAIAYWTGLTTSRIDTFSSTNANIQTGITTSTLTNVSGAYASIGLAARQVGAVHQVFIAHWANSATYLTTLYNVDTGASIYTANFAVSAVRAVDISVNTTDNNFILAYVNSSTAYIRTLSTTNTVSVDNPLTGAQQGSVAIKGLASGNIIIMATSNRASASIFLLNGTYTAIAGTRIEINNISTPIINGNAIIDNGDGTVFIYQSTPANGIPDNSLAYQQYATSYLGFMFRYKVSATTGLQIPANSTYTSTASVGNTGTLTLSGYVRNASTPAVASFYAAATSTQSLTQAASSGTTNFVTSQLAIESVACDSMDSDTLANGNIVFVYRYAGTPYTVKYAIYTPTGTLVTSGTAGTGISSNDQYQSAYVAALPNGKFGVFFYTASATVAYRIYSAAGDLLASGNVGFSNLTNYSAGSRYINVAGLTSNRFAFAYTTTTPYLAYLVMDDTGTTIAAQTVISLDLRYPGIAGTPNGGFVTYGMLSGSYYAAYRLVPTSTSAYAVAGQYTNFGSSSDGLVTNSIAVAPDGTPFIYVPANGTTTQLSSYSCDLQRQNTSQNIGGANSNNAYATVGVTGSGMAVAYNQTSTEQYIVTYGAGTFSNTAITMSVTTSALRSSPTISAGSGDNFVLGLLNSSRFPSFAILNSLGNTFSATITAGVTVSNPTTISPFTTGHYMTGVSVTSCSAGGSGIVQTNGTAQLNTNYSASTTGQYFDFDVNPAVPGVKGSITGRTVTMTRN